MKGRGSRIALVVVLVGLAVAVIALGRGGAPTPFDARSAAPDGYGALRILLEQRGVEVRSLTAAEATRTPVGAGEALVVPVADYASPRQSDAFADAARRGATVVLGAPGYFAPLDANYLTRTPAVVVERGECDIASLGSLRAIDAIDGGGVDVTEGDSSCFGVGLRAQVVAEPTGEGETVTLASPYLWANARLWPDKEEGGRIYDNGPMAVALLDGARRVTFVDAVPSPGAEVSGSENPISLMPLGVKLALAQVVGAFVIYAWWRGRRLGRPVSEQMPVEVAGSEMVEAVGGLLRRGGSPARAGEVLRCEQRARLCARLGVPPSAGPAALVSVVAQRSGRDPVEVAEILVGAGRIAGTDDLVRLARNLDSLGTEVLDGARQPVG